MRCFNCNTQLTDRDFCENCGVNVSVYKKILRTANAYYNDGLAKAKVRDLTGAAESLRRSVKYNKYHTDARNLLGLVYYETGDTLHALAEWVISASLQEKDNAANRYLRELQGNAGMLERARNAIKKYNIALGYVQSGSEDLAVIQLKRVIALNDRMLQAYQLLALLQMKRGDYRKAKKNLRLAQQIDTNNTTTLVYLKEVDRLYAERSGNPEHLTSTGTNRDRTAYYSGNDLVIQPTSYKESHHFRGVLTLLVGFAAGILVAWFLILPVQKDRIRGEYQAKEQEMLAKLADASATAAGETQQETEAPADKKEPDETESAAATLAPAGTENAAGEPAVSASPSPDTLDPEVYGDVSQMQLDESMTVDAYFARGQEWYDYGNYEDAIANLQKAVAIDDTHLWTLYYLGRAYQQLDEADKAITVYERIIMLYPDDELADDARRFIGELQE